MTLLLVGIGGALGSFTRYKIGIIISKKVSQKFPFHTYIINISGALLLGFLNGFDVEKNIYLLIGDGFFGAYTTFSTFMYEGFNLFKNKKKLNASFYILSSIIIGIIGYAVGYFISKNLR